MWAGWPSGGFVDAVRGNDSVNKATYIETILRTMMERPKDLDLNIIVRTQETWSKKARIERHRQNLSRPRDYINAVQYRAGDAPAHGHRKLGIDQ